ncbi:hypothetical protein [Streptomyces sp. enrichment culture]
MTVEIAEALAVIRLDLGGSASPTRFLQKQRRHDHAALRRPERRQTVR